MGGEERHLCEEVGAEVKRLRLKRGWNRPRLAAEAKVPARTVFVVEEGLCNPTILTLARLGGALGVKVVDLFVREGE